MTFDSSNKTEQLKLILNIFMLRLLLLLLLLSKKFWEFFYSAPSLVYLLSLSEAQSQFETWKEGGDSGLIFPSISGGGDHPQLGSMFMTIYPADILASSFS